MYNLHPTILEMVAERENLERARAAERRRILEDRVHFDNGSRVGVGTFRSLLNALRHPESHS